MTLEYLSLAVYFILLLTLGTLFSRFNKNLSDFVRGGSRGTWWLVGTSITMSGISAFTFTGNGSAAFEAGPSLLVIYLANLSGFAMGGLFLARWYRQTRAMTGADVIRGRYGTGVEQFSIYSGLLMVPIFAAVQLWALAVFCSSVFGVPLHATIVVVGLIVLVYSVSGGVWAVMATDFVQGIVLYSMTLIVAVLAIKEVGGLGEFFEYFTKPEFAGMDGLFKEPGQYPGNKFTVQWAVVIFLMQFLGQVQLSQAGRYLSVKDGREATRSAWWAFFLMAIGSLVWFIPPMVARFLYAEDVLALPMDDPATGAYAVIAIKLLPSGLVGIMIAAMFAATMSSMDSGINGQTGVIVNNIIGRIREWQHRDPLSDAVYVRLCRVISTILGFTVIGCSLLLAAQDKVKLFDVFLYIGSVIGTPMVMPMIGGLIFRRLPPWSYYIMFGGSCLPSIYEQMAVKSCGMAPWTIQERGAWVLGFGVLAVLISVPLARFSSARHRERENKFFEQMFRPVDFEKEIGGANDVAQATLIGRTVVVMAGLLCTLLFLPNPWSGRLVILSLIAMVAAAGLVLLWSARNHS